LDKSRIWLIGFVIAAILMLLTVYLAIFYAPIPQTGVKSANEILDTLDGSEIKIAGFVSKIHMSDSNKIELSIADFSDYQGWLNKAPEDELDWFVVYPIDVSIDISGGDLSIADGTNISVLGTVSSDTIGTYSQISGYSLKSQTDNVVIGISAGEFEITTAPVAQKIFYFHMPAAWVSYVAFGVTLVGSILYLKKREMKYDNAAHSAVEIGIIFATIAILTGPVWAKEEWGVYWRWEDTKLLTTFILWLVYIGYLSLRAAMADPLTRARTAAVYGIISFITVPMSLLSSRIAPLLRSSHPQVIATSSGGLSPEAGLTVGIAVMAFTFMFIVILMKRMELNRMEYELEELKKEVGGEI